MIVRLEPLDRSNAVEVVRWRNDPRVASQLFSERGPTIEEHFSWVSALAGRPDRQEFLIVEKANGRPVGTIGLSAIDRERGVAEYGILLDPEAQGKGFGRAASELLIRHAFEELGLREIVLELFADNEPARHLYERLGFELKGHGTRVKDGRVRPTLIMRLPLERYQAEQERA